MVVPFDQCVARPDQGGRRFPLIKHLETVARGCGTPRGAPDDRLAFLAGLLHDAAKAQATWQEYISGRLRRGPPHAPLGAALFAFCADSLNNVWSRDRTSREHFNDIALDWTRAVYDHHGKLDDLDVLPPWEEFRRTSDLWNMFVACDGDGLFSLIRKHFPESDANGPQFHAWLENFAPEWGRRLRVGRERLLRQLARQHLNGAGSVNAFRLPQVAARLIRADRYDAGRFERCELSPTEADCALRRLEAYLDELSSRNLEEGANPELVRERGELQRAAVQRYRHNTQGTYFTLLLPTGYGKTLTSLRIALEACRTSRCNRIIYVAPYLSILSQAAKEISEATGLEVFQHHHLTLAESADDQDVDVLDTWQAPILATTFNQLFRALFPDRVQECLRTEALYNSFVIVDEPQIVSVAVWNVFLRGLALMNQEWGCQLLFSTATLPPTNDGLTQPVIPLAPQVTPLGRFRLSYEDCPLTASDLVERVLQCRTRGGGIAIVLNSVRDTATVYRLLKGHVEHPTLYCLTAAMLASHKAATIDLIREQLQAKQPVVVVCTQILEAGVNLSFQVILRALPILPSIVQVAGRANRHGEGARGTVFIFPFRREDGRDSRPFVYRDETARRQTDALLTEHAELREEDVTTTLQIYFQRCWEENRHMAGLDKMDQAARGCWSALAGMEPFGGDAARDEVFVPINCEWKLNAPTQSLLDRFAPDGPEQLLSNCRDPVFLAQLSFHDRKRLRSLLHQFTVSLPRRLAQQVAEPVTEWLWRLTQQADYSLETGLAHLWESDEEPSLQII